MHCLHVVRVLNLKWIVYYQKLFNDAGLASCLVPVARFVVVIVVSGIARVVVVMRDIAIPLEVGRAIVCNGIVMGEMVPFVGQNVEQQLTH